MQNLIPEHKDDQEKIKLLEEQSFEKIIPIVPQLLEWLQDGNWPISSPLSEFLNKHISKISSHYIEVLNGNDGTWKYFLIHSLAGIPKDQIPLDLLKKITSIANSPNPLEKREEVDEVAQWLLE
jgi:hypothetical protein